MKIKIQRNDLFMEAACLLCGEAIPPDIVMAKAYSHDGRRAFGEVCPVCLSEGAEAAAGKLREQIETMRGRAERLLTMADKLQAETEHPLEMPSLAAWRNKHLQVFLNGLDLADETTVKQFQATVVGWSDAELQIFLEQTESSGSYSNPFEQARYAIAWHEKTCRDEKNLNPPIE